MTKMDKWHRKWKYTKSSRYLEFILRRTIFHSSTIKTSNHFFFKTKTKQNRERERERGNLPGKHMLAMNLNVSIYFIPHIQTKCSHFLICSSDSHNICQRSIRTSSNKFISFHQMPSCSLLCCYLLFKNNNVNQGCKPHYHSLSLWTNLKITTQFQLHFRGQYIVNKTV